MVRPNSEAHFDVFLSHNGPLARCLAEHQQPPIDGLSGQHCPQTDEPYPADGTYQPSQKCDDIAMFNISPNFLPESDVDMGSERIHESSLFPSNFPQSSHTTYAPFQRCLLANTIRQEIHKLLTKPELEVLRLNLLADRTDCDAVALLLPEEKMLDCDYIEKAITAYHIAVEAVLDKLLNGNSNSNVGFLKTLLGWLILLSVNDVWMNVFKNKFEKWQTVEFIELPLEKELGAAVVIARWGKKNAEIKMDGRYAEVYGERQFRAEFFEEDLRRTDALTDLKRAIWKSVYKDFEPPRNGNDKTLANVLKIRYERGTPHYIILNSTQYQALTNRNRQIIVQLRNDLPYLGTVVIGTNTGNEAMILPESTLEALIFEFLNMLKTGK